MRSPVIAFSILAAAAVSPSLVAGAPTSPNPDAAPPRQLSNAIGMNHLDTSGLPVQPPVTPPSVPVTPPSALNALFGGASSVPSPPKPDPTAHRQAEQQLHKPATSPMEQYTSNRKRAQDMNSAGGNSYTGATTDTSGGSVVSVAHGGGDEDEEEFPPGVTNDGGNQAGDGGTGYSGYSYGGSGDGKGAGGNAYSGAVGPSYGGDVVSSSTGDGRIPSVVDNEEPNNAGVGGFDQSGDATGGDAGDNQLDNVDATFNTHSTRAMEMDTAGGNAYTGASSNVDGGNIINHTDNQGFVESDEPQTAGAAGETYSGYATGGAGDGFGPGGNAYSGSTGSAVGGSVINSGGAVYTDDTTTAGAGGISESGDADGGDA